MSRHPLAGYEDWPDYVRNRPLVSGDDWTTRVAGLFGVPEPVAAPEPRVRRTWTSTCDGVAVTTTELVWPVGFGPELHAWLLKPRDREPGTLPGVLTLHSHGGLKSIGAARLVAEAGGGEAYRARYEGGVAFATRLAARGALVLAPDAFSWGSRGFGLDEPYDVSAASHEHEIAKYAAALGTSYAGMVAHDDLTALRLLRSFGPNWIGVTGFSGGGGRAALVSAIEAVDRVSIAAMMTTYDALVPDHVSAHSWLLHTPRAYRDLDLPALAAGRRTHDLQVIYLSDDPLFPRAGMHAADRSLRALFRGQRGTYRGCWVEAGHEFGVSSQDRAVDFLTRA